MSLPFLTYLTVFKSRLGLPNLVLDATGLTHQSTARVIRKIQGTLEAKSDIDFSLPENRYIAQYLLEKKIISSNPRAKVRYEGHSLEERDDSWIVGGKRGEESTVLPVYQTDLWMAAPDIASTIGVPTSENAAELLELTNQLRLVTKASKTWTAAGQVVQTLRSVVADGTSDQNPFVLRAEASALLRQVLSTDGVMLRALVPVLLEIGPAITRTQVAGSFSAVVDVAVAEAKRMRLAPGEMRDVNAFNKLIRDQATKMKKGQEKARTERRGLSRAPGVLEHRVSPRLEWLTDLGYLTKEGLPKNSFEYRATDALQHLNEVMASVRFDEQWPDEVAIAEWRTNPYWSRFRKEMPSEPFTDAIRTAYRLVQRHIGPAPLREVTFLTALFNDRPASVSTVGEQVIAFARETEGVNLSRGRYRRELENIFISASALER